MFFITFNQYQKTFHLSYYTRLYHKVDIFIVTNFSIVFDIVLDKRRLIKYNGFCARYRNVLGGADSAPPLPGIGLTPTYYLLHPPSSRSQSIELLAEIVFTYPGLIGCLEEPILQMRQYHSQDKISGIMNVPPTV